MRALIAVVCIGALAACAFGFAATFEPLERGSQLAWRATYSAVGLLALAGLIRTALPSAGRRERDDAER